MQIGDLRAFPGAEPGDVPGKAGNIGPNRAATHTGKSQQTPQGGRGDFRSHPRPVQRQRRKESERGTGTFQSGPEDRADGEIETPGEIGGVHPLFPFKLHLAEQ